MTNNTNPEEKTMTDTETPAVRLRPFSRMEFDGDYETTHFTDGARVVTRRDWTPEDATVDLLDEWLYPTVHLGDDTIDPQPAHLVAARHARFIRDGGRTVGVLISAEEYEEGRAAIRRINEDAYGTPETKYKPFQHAPNATTDRIIDTEVLERIIRDDLHGKDADITRAELDRIHYRALIAALEFSFDPDSRGLVPVMTPGRAADHSVNEYHWSLLYKTPVAGIYLRADDDILGGITYTLTAGSGYALVGGFYERDYADELAVKIATALPGIEWFTLTPHDLTPEIRSTVAELVREHGRWRKDTEETAA